MHIGMHLSIAGGLPQSLVRAHVLGCSALQIFVQNPRAWGWRPVPAEEIASFRENRQRYGIKVIAAHLSYLPNLAASDEPLSRRSWERLRAELTLAQALGLDFLVCHPGHAVDPEAGQHRLIAGLQGVVTALPPPPLILLENTAGQKNELGASLIALGEILSLCQVPVGLCLDTAHAFAAGYNLRQAEHRRRLGREIAAGPGLKALRLIHLNDSLHPCGSRRDRHWHLGQGRIGRLGLRKFISEYASAAAALILETPKKEPTDDLRNLALAKELAGSLLRETPATTPRAPDPIGGGR
jgi:deoxyribonuclease-4